MNWDNFDREDFIREGNGQGNGPSGILKEK